MFVSCSLFLFLNICFNETTTKIVHKNWILSTHFLSSPTLSCSLALSLSLSLSLTLSLTHSLTHSLSHICSITHLPMVCIIGCWFKHIFNRKGLRVAKARHYPHQDNWVLLWSLPSLTLSPFLYHPLSLSIY